MKNIINEFIAVLDEKSVISDNFLKEPYETDWRNRYKNNALAVLLPENTFQISLIIKICEKYKIGIIPQGGNTSLCGSSIPTSLQSPQVIINLKKLNKILTVDINNSNIIIESGCTLKQIQEEAAKYNLYFPLSMSSEGNCQIGGNIATNAGGIHVIKYGTMRDLILGVEIVLANGEIINQLQSLRKNNTNFDLKQLFIGSEGTLGIITKASLKLYPQPQNYCTSLIAIKSLANAIKILQELKPFNLCAFEIMDKNSQLIYNQHFTNRKIAIEENWLILFELETDINFNIDIITKILYNNKVNMNQVILASNHKERKKIWQIREELPLAEKSNGFAIKHDISLPISNIEEFINANTNNIMNKYHKAFINIFGHLGDGNLHYNVNFPMQSKDYIETQEITINQIVYEDVIKFGGSFSAEHGIGILKKSWFKKYYDINSYNLAKSIKILLDPNNILNPGKVF
ncbi:MAG TPA: FAD-binding oxidoreductase [Burkholderiales bacterium]|nr:FAD-binding oxidoreductase [Burkholderiales bacterium]